MEYPRITRSNFQKMILEVNPRLDMKNINRALDLAERAHLDQKRASGEDYIIHPLNVAYIIAELGFDAQSIIAAILHDVVEDSSLTVPEVKEFYGEEIAYLVDALTKITDLPEEAGKSAKKAENYRKFLLAITRDVRVVFIKIADRLHNMRTLHHLKVAKRRSIARETLAIYIPLANRFGLQDIKREMEDLCLKYLYPEIYRELHQVVKEKKSSRDSYINEFISTVYNLLEVEEIEADINGRSKHFWSIFRKKVQRNITYDEINDYYAIRIITSQVEDCFTALGIINTVFQPLPLTYKDYITQPKSNGYQSLHQVVISAENKKVEIQIRTREMHIYAEEGPAAHWKYKEFAHLEHIDSSSRPRLDKAFDEQVTWLRELITLYRQDNPENFIHSLKEKFFKDKIIVKTPDSDYLELPLGSTPLDFAFAVHSEVGLHCLSAKVNGRHVSLRYQLQDGDQIAIVTARNVRPSKDWLEILTTPRAQQRVRAWFRQRETEDAVILGKSIFEKEIRKHDLHITDQDVLTLAQSLKLSGALALYADLGQGNILIDKALDILQPTHKQPESISLPAQDKDFSVDASQPFIEIQGLENLMMHFAHCCNPLPGDDIIGYITRGRGLSVHRQDCANPAFQQLRQKEPHRIMHLLWQKPDKTLNQVIRLLLIALPRPRLNYDITTLLSQQKIKTHTSSSQLSGDHEHITLVVEVTDRKQIKNLTSALLKINSILEVYQI
ncbi:MAG: bifunctional (p)ppGpp synthetase/guanosine-3',5'-bis(diphosphate) 3'-pyrophosphohydrolase [Candidatus Cloacimonetes bacterium]|nr:bifunctional (p)ppGpp synthetase/guanosine-3',5'-bis(diphosphate) 3'-pyrophosphohydrolase [Candidatus Cloacimonadota bacterium]